MKKIYQLIEEGEKGFHAGQKAPADVSAILRTMGAEELRIKRFCSHNCVLRNLGRIHWVIQSWIVRFQITRGAILVVQYPARFLEGRLGFDFLGGLKRTRDVRVITIFHDINDLRAEKFVSPSEATRKIFEISDATIVHNARMRDWVHHHIGSGKETVELGIFDYLIPSGMNRVQHVPMHIPPVVSIAGNLKIDKSGYLRELHSICGVVWNLYGVNYNHQEVKGPDVHYKGSFSPEDLPLRLSGDFGLVWDGPTAKTCSGAFGNYLRFNNPHKLSLYIASGLPVVIWSESAEAQFVQRHNLGICVSSLHELPGRLNELSQDDYLAMRRSVADCADKLLKGEYSRRAMQNAVQILEERCGLK